MFPTVRMYRHRPPAGIDQPVISGTASITSQQEASRTRGQWFVLSTILLLAFAIPSTAQEESAADAWAQGTQAFAAEDYLRALSHFQRARNAGQAGPAVHYNIGVCQYKLQHYDEARQTFTLLNDRYPKMRPLAQYNLGLVALKLSQRDIAVRHFRESYYQASGDPKLRAMSSTMLRRMIDETVPSSQWLRMVSLRGGFDDNVTLQDEASIVTDASTESPFIELFGTLSGPYSSRGGLRLDGGFYIVNYSDADDFNQASIYLGGVYEWRGAQWGADVGAHAGATTLGGDGYDRSGRFSARISRKLSTEGSLAFRYRYDDITAAEAVFDDIEGTRQRFELRYRWYRDGRSFNARLAHEANDRADPGISPDRNTVSFDYRYSPEAGWGFAIGTELRASDYAAAMPARDEDLAQANLTLLRNTAAGWQLFAEYRWAHNDSSEPVFSYTRNQFSVGVFRMF